MCGVVPIHLYKIIILIQLNKIHILKLKNLKLKVKIIFFSYPNETLKYIKYLFEESNLLPFCVTYWKGSTYVYVLSMSLPARPENTLLVG